MDVDMEDGRVRGVRGLPERQLGMVNIGKRPRAPEIEQRMSAGGAEPSIVR